MVKAALVRLKCQHSGFAVALTFRPWVIIFEYCTLRRALSAKCGRTWTRH